MRIPLLIFLFVSKTVKSIVFNAKSWKRKFIFIPLNTPLVCM